METGFVVYKGQIICGSFEKANLAQSLRFLVEADKGAFVNWPLLNFLMLDKHRCFEALQWDFLQDRTLL